MSHHKLNFVDSRDAGVKFIV